MPAVLYRGGVTLSEINSFPNQIAQIIAAVSIAMTPITKLIRLKRGKQRSI
jgi:hypothetical protein